MNVSIGQIYVKPGISFPFSHLMQQWVSEELSSLSGPGTAFKQKYGAAFSLMLRISADTNIIENVIKGPTVFKRTKDVEYTIFLPFDVIKAAPDGCATAMRYILAGVREVFSLIGISTAALEASEQSIIHRVCSDPEMLRTDAAWPH